MRSYTYLLFLVLVLFNACKTKSSENIDLPMPEEKIIDILIDMHYAGEAARITKDINHDSLYQVYTNQVLEIQKIDSTQLKDLMTFLHSNLETFYGIEQKVHLRIKDIKKD